MSKQVIFVLLLVSLIIWAILLILLNNSFPSLMKASEIPYLNTDGYLGENIVRDSQTGFYWWIFSDRTDDTIKLAKSSDLKTWEVEKTSVAIDADSACLRRFGGIWYIYFGKRLDDKSSRANIWMIHSASINQNYSDPIPILEVSDNIKDWDFWRVSEPDIIWNDGLYYLFYMGESSDKIEKIGYAISNSAMGPFKKYDQNPVLSGSSSFYGIAWNAGKDKAADPYVDKIGDWFVIQHTACSVSKREWNIGLAITKNLVDFYCPTYPILSRTSVSWCSQGVSRGGLMQIGNKWYISYSGYNLDCHYGGRSSVSPIDLDSIVNMIRSDYLKATK